MYSDMDGIATKESQAAYDTRLRYLIFMTSLLSWIGFGAAILDGAYTKENMSLATLRDGSLLKHISRALWPIIVLHNHFYDWKYTPKSIHSAGLRGSVLSLLAVASQLHTELVHTTASHSATSWSSLQFYVAVSLTTVQVLIPHRPRLFTPEGEAVDLEGSASAFGRYTMQWCTSALDLAGKPVPANDLPVLDYATRSRSQSSLLPIHPGITLWSRIVTERRLGFVKQWTIMLARSIITFGSPYCIMQLLKSLENNPGRTSGAWIWLLGAGASSLAQTVINHHLIWIQWSEMGIPIRAQLIMAIFQKALRKKDCKDANNKTSDKPDALNLISSDTSSFSKFTAVNYIIPASFVRFSFATVFLWRLLGWQSTLVAMIATALCVPVHTFFVKQQRSAQKKLTTARDKRSKVLTEALQNLRQIKFSAMEAQWEEHIETFRQEEVACLIKTFTISNLRSVWGVAAPFIVATAAVLAYVRVQGTVIPSVIFPLIEVLPHLQGTLSFVPVVFQDYFGARSNASRMEEYLRRPEQKDIRDRSLSDRVCFHDATISWPSDEEVENGADRKHRYSLHGISLQFPVGELSIIAGKTGSGKSLLLNAIIGEVELLSGRIESPTGAPIAFVSQAPWLQNATVKENILFGSPYEEERYEMAVKACALQTDLAALAQGHDTQIGPRGVKLSGGQRARVALCRALYSKAKLLVLDDIFSALDSHVSKDILNALTGELCQGRTRILVTHHVSLCLPRARYIVYLKDNTIEYAGNTDPGFIGNQLSVLESEAPLSNRPAEEVESKPDVNNKKPKSKTAPRSVKKLNARADLTVYKNYFIAAGGIGFTIICFLGLVSKQLLTALTTWLLGRINSGHPSRASSQPEKMLSSQADANNGLLDYLSLYMLTSLMAIALEYVFNIYTSSGSVRASRSLFRAMISKVLRMPILWLDTTPVGGLLRVFSVDIKSVDDSVFGEISSFADCIVKLVTIVSVGLLTSGRTSILTVALLSWCIHVSRRYIRARTTVKRADAVPTADILEHFTTSANGVATIRAFGAVERSIDLMHQHLDRLSKARRHFWIFNRWLGLQMSFVGIAFSMGIGVIMLSTQSVVDASLLGFSLTFSMGFSQAIFKAVNSFGILETYMDAAGSVLGYTELGIEEQGGEQVAENWPAHGKVEVKALQVAYAADVPLVLKDMSFSLRGGQKLGIVGRTGAGKSSLTLALLRVLRPQSGSIHIDGVDISNIKLSSLRSRVAYIPQDPVLFSGTVRANLDYFQQVSENRLKDVLRRVNLLADGQEVEGKSGLFTLESQISAGGANMSQGQRQLLCFARLLITNPRIMILDEATSAVDNETDLLVQEIIRTEFTGTLIVVAHRLRTIASFDRVMVMSDGKAMESGKPAELLKSKGAFYDLVQASEDKKFLMSNILE